MGLSGSGKTTITKALEAELKILDYKTTRKVEFEYFILKYVLKIFESTKKPVLPNIRKYVVEGNRASIYKLWLIFVLLDHISTHIFYSFFKRNHTVLFDRYIYDFLIGLELMGGKSKLLRWLYYNSPRTNKLFILDISPEKALEREKADPLQTCPLQELGFYVCMRKKYLKIAEDLKLKVINTDDPLESTLSKVVSLLGF
jgi:thymidylate kinase